MKWVIAIHDFGLGGSEKTVIHQANLLFERGHEVFFITMLKKARMDLRPTLRIPSNHVFHFPFQSYLDLRSFPALIRFLKKNRPDVVLSASLFTNTILKATKFFYPTMRLIVREGNILRRHGRGSIWFDRLTQGLVSKFIVNARAIKEDLIEKLGIPEQKIAVLYNGIDIKDTTDQKKLDMPEDAFILMHVGSMNSHQKGQEHLIEALQHVPRDVYAVFIGDGHRKPELEALSKTCGVYDRVRFLGKQEEPLAFLKEANVFVFPSLWEGMPNALFEAMASGLPIIATPVGGVPEVIRDRVSGLLVPAGDTHALVRAIQKLYDDRDLGRQLGIAARETIGQEQFTWKYHVDHLIALCAAS